MASDWRDRILGWMNRKADAIRLEARGGVFGAALHGLTPEDRDHFPGWLRLKMHAEWSRVLLPCMDENLAILRQIDGEALLDRLDLDGLVKILHEAHQNPEAWAWNIRKEVWQNTLFIAASVTTVAVDLGVEADIDKKDLWEVEVESAKVLAAHGK